MNYKKDILMRMLMIFLEKLSQLLSKKRISEITNSDMNELYILAFNEKRNLLLSLDKKDLQNKCRVESTLSFEKIKVLAELLYIETQRTKNIDFAKKSLFFFNLFLKHSKIYDFEIIFILLRIFDLITTFFVTNDLASETSPLVRIFNWGWLGIILLNSIFILIVAFLLFYISPSHLNTVAKESTQKNYKLNEYYQHILFQIKEKEERISMFRLLIKEKINTPIFIYFSTRAIILTFIVVSIFAIINNVLLLFDFCLLENINSNNITNYLFLFIVCLFIIFFNISVIQNYKKDKK